MKWLFVSGKRPSKQWVGSDKAIQERGLKIFYEVGKSAVSGYLEHLLSLIVNLTAELIQCDICSIMILDPEKDTLTVRATQSLDKEYLAKGPLKLNESLSGLVLGRRKSMQWEDVTQEPKFRYLSMAKRMGLKSLLSIPMMTGEKPIGVINFYTTQRRIFSDTEIRFLEAIANQATLAIEQHDWKKQAKKMEAALRERRLMEKAKGVLMEKKNLTEREAHELLRKTSMNTRKSMEEIAKAILLTESI
jgi:signal transduction protein with GAF and PtsI domain